MTHNLQVDDHPNARLMHRIYETFARGDLVAVGELLADDITYHFHGRSHLAGDKQGKQEVFAFWSRQFELSGGTLRVEPTLILGGLDYGIAFVVVSASRDGQAFSAPGVNIMRFEHSKAAEFWSFTADQYAVDEFWG